MSNAEDALLADVTKQILRAMEEIGFNHTDLARYLGCSKPNIAQLLNGERNFTLRKLSDICTVLGVQPTFTLTPRAIEKDSE